MTRLWSAGAIAAVVCMGFHGASADEAIDLSQVEGIEGFSGKEEARDRLARLGFIVVREEFKLEREYLLHNFRRLRATLWHARRSSGIPVSSSTAASWGLGIRLRDLRRR
jgi:hypothetical protein